MKYIKNLISIIGIASLVLTNLAGIFSKIDFLKPFFFSYPYQVLSMCFVFSLTPIFPLRVVKNGVGFASKTQVTYPNIWIKMIFLSLVIVMFTYGLIQTNILIGSEEVGTVSKRYQVFDSVATRIDIIDTKSSDEPLLVDDSLNQIDLSSVRVRLNFGEKFSSHNDSTDEKGSLYIFPDDAIIDNMVNLDGGLPADELLYNEIIQWLRKRVDAENLGPLVHSISDDTNLRLLVDSRFRDLKSLNLSFEQIASLSDQEVEIYMTWNRIYLGQWCPKIIFNIDNNLNSPFRVISVLYDVEDYSVYRRSQGNRVFGDNLYTFSLESRAGRQRLNLASLLGGERTIKTQETEEIELIFCPSSNGDNLAAWDGVIRLETNKGIINVGRLNIKTYSNHAGMSF